MGSKSASLQSSASFLSMMKVLWCLLLVAASVAGASTCTDGDTAAIDGKCREFQVCKNGEWTKDSCNTPLRKYSKEQKKCMWWFQVECVEATQCSEENVLLKNPYTCSSYYECSEGKLLKHSCIWPFYFDGEKCKFWGDCQQTGTGDKYAEECSGEEAEPMADSARQYKTCVNGFFVQTACWWGKKFDVDTKSCQWFWNVKNDVTACDGKPRTTDDSEGKTYYQCDTNTGILLKKSCPILQKFDADQGRCVMSLKSINLNEVNGTVNSEEAVQAVKNLSELLSSVVPKAPAENNGTVSIKRVLRSIRNSYLTDTSCTDGSYQTDLNCLNYKVCIGNTWVTRSCPPGMLFSNGGCKWQWQAQCNPGSCITGQTSVYKPDCTKYLLCNENNQEIVQDCSEGVLKRHYDESSGSCKVVWWWSKCPSYSSETCSEGGVFNPTTKVCEKARSKRSLETENPRDCASGDTKADLINGVCSTYMFCTQDGIWTRRACPPEEYYNGQKGCGKDLCPYTPVPGDCESFMMADGLKERCVFGFRFDSVTRQCVPFANATCLAIECEGRERKNHPVSCSQYLQCQDQRWEVKDCSWYHNKFDMKTRECIFEWWGSKASCRYDHAKCKEGSSTPLPGDCRRYVTCTNQREHEQSCFWPKKFDEISSKCVWWGGKCA